MGTKYKCEHKKYWYQGRRAALKELAAEYGVSEGTIRYRMA